MNEEKNDVQFLVVHKMSYPRGRRPKLALCWPRGEVVRSEANGRLYHVDDNGTVRRVRG
jgi:uncharacterized Fe-S cluster-containing radical SAM superfamily enzyme